MKHVHKYSGNIETFNSKKLNASLVKLLRSNHYSHSKSKEIADEVTKKTVAWISQKTEVTHRDIRAQAAKHLKVFDKNTADLYNNHKNLD